MIGFASRVKRLRRLSVRIDSRSNVGNARNVSSSCWLRSAIVPKTVFELRISPVS